MVFALILVIQIQYKLEGSRLINEYGYAYDGLDDQGL